MEMQKSFSQTAFGGFKKEEVTQYIDELITKYDIELKEITEKLAAADSQISEFKTIIEQQYDKIVKLTDENEKFVCVNNKVSKDNEEICKKNDELVQQLKPFIYAKTQANEIIEIAKNNADALSNSVKEQVMQAAEQAKKLFEQANEKSKNIIIPAQNEADLLIKNAKEKANEIVNSAKNQETQLIESIKNEIEKTLTANEENQKKEKGLIEAAQQEAERILEQAKLAADGEKSHYDACLKALDEQKSKLLLSLDEIKGSVQAIQIIHLPKSEVETFQALRQATTEAIRKKFAMLNNINFGQKNH